MTYFDVFRVQLSVLMTLALTIPAMLDAMIALLVILTGKLSVTVVVSEFTAFAPCKAWLWRA